MHAREAARTTVSRYVKTEEFEDLLLKELKGPEVQSIINRSIQGNAPLFLDNATQSDSIDVDQLTIAAGDEGEAV